MSDKEEAVGLFKLYEVEILEALKEAFKRWSVVPDDLLVDLDVPAVSWCITSLMKKGLEKSSKRSKIRFRVIKHSGSCFFFFGETIKGRGFLLRVAKGDRNFLTSDNDSERLRNFKEQRQQVIPGFDSPLNLELVWQYDVSRKKLGAVSLVKPRGDTNEWTYRATGEAKIVSLHSQVEKDFEQEPLEPRRMHPTSNAKRGRKDYGSKRGTSSES